MPDALAPLAAAIITKDLESEKRIAFTAVAAFIDGPLALAPAIVALQRARAETKATDTAAVAKAASPPGSAAEMAASATSPP